MNAEELIKGLEQYSPEDRLKIIKGLQKDGVKINGLDLNRPPEQALQALQGVKKTGISDGDGLAPKVGNGNESKREALKKMGETQREFMKRTISVMDLSDKLNVMDDAEKIDYLKKLQKEGYSLSSEGLGGKKVSNDWLKGIDLDNPKDFGKVKNKIVSAGVKTAQQQFSKGGRKSIEQTATGLASLAGKGVEKTAGLAGADIDITSGLDKFRDEKLAYKNRGENIGGTATDLATLFTGGGAAAKLAGKAEDAITFGQKFKRLSKLSGLEAGATGAYSAAKEGELNSKVAKDAAFAGGLTFGLGSVFGTGKKALSWLAEPKDSRAYRKAVEALEKGGVDERSLNIIKNLDDEGRKALLTSVDATKKRLSGDITAKGAMAEAAQEVDDFFASALKKKKQIGADVGRVKEEVLANMDAPTNAVRKQTLEIMKKLGVKFKSKPETLIPSELENIGFQSKVPLSQLSKVKKGAELTPDFSNSILSKSKEARDVFLDILNITKKKRVNALDLERVTDRIDVGTKILKTVKGFNASQFDTAISNAKTAVNQTLHKISPEFGKVNTKNAKFMSLFGQLRDAGKVDVGGGKQKFKGWQILQRSLGNASAKPEEALESIKGLKAFGLKSPKNMNLKAELASIAARMTGDVNPTSLEGVVSQAGAMAANAVPGGQVLASAFKFAKNLKKAKKGTELLSTIAKTSSKPKPQPIVNLLKKNLTGAGSRVIIPSAIAGLFAKRD